MGISAGKVPDPRHILLKPGDFSIHSWQLSHNSDPAMPRSFLVAVFLGYQVSCLSAVVEDEGNAVAERDFLGLQAGL